MRHDYCILGREYYCIPGENPFSIIVGYQADETAKDTYHMLVPSFTAIGKDAQTLADIKIVSGNTTKITFGNTQLVVFGTSGDPQFICDDETLEEFCPEAYAAFSDDDEAELIFTFDENKVHWYLLADADKAYPVDAYPLIQGRGYNMNCARTLAKGATITVAGQVATEGCPVEMEKDTYFPSGNMMPVDWKLSDFTLESGNTTKITFGNNQIVMFGEAGDPQLVCDDETLEETYPEVYAIFSQDDEAELIFTFDENKEHWYLLSDADKSYPVDNYPILAGQGFILNCARTLAKGYTFTVPSPLEDK